MVPSTTTPITGNGNGNDPPSFWQWTSPLPYLFGSLGFMVALIAVALVMLACSIRKQSSRSSSSTSAAAAAAAAMEEKSIKVGIDDDSSNNSVPQILVIMAGDDNPTHLAIPISDLPHHIRQSSPAATVIA